MTFTLTPYEMKDETTPRQQDYAKSLGKKLRSEVGKMWERRIDAQKRNSIKLDLPDNCIGCGHGIDKRIFRDGLALCGKCWRKAHK